MDKVKILSLMYRKKDNPRYVKSEGGVYILREVYSVGSLGVREDKIKKLEAIRTVYQTGTWRLYETVNSRYTEKAKTILQHRLIDGTVGVSKIDSVWKSILQSIECRAERNLLLDLDGCSWEEFYSVLMDIHDMGVAILEKYRTLNGFHIITEKFNYKVIAEKYGFIDVKRDGMKLLKVYKDSK